MDPITFGMVSISIAGGTLYLVALLEKRGFKVNEEAVTFVLELIKAGGLLYLLEHLSKLFL